MEDEELKAKKDKYRETVSKLFIDMSKIVFTGVVIGGISPAFINSQNVNYWFVVSGFVISLLSALIGCIILKP